jgi:four helix bundle protein
MRDFRQIQAWEKAHRVTLRIYALTRNFPKEETYGLVAQMRRSAASIPTNIAEGCGRNSGRELARFSEIAMGSATELEYQVILAQDLGYLRDPLNSTTLKEVIEVQKMLGTFIRKIREAAGR